MGRHRESSELAGFLRRMSRALVRRAEAGDTDALVALVNHRKDVDVAIKDAGAALYEKGYTWEAIGAELGVSKQAAEKRFG